MSNLKAKIEWQTKHWTIVSDLPPLTLVLIKKGQCQIRIDHRHPMIHINNKLLFGIV